jgi:NAD(P)H-dependent FMN reductase
MSSILAFAGSNSSTSINYKLVKYTATLVKDKKIKLVDMSKYPFPMYSEDYEKEHGFTKSLMEFKDEISSATGLIIAVNEHNSYPSAYFKNVIDWLSRLDAKFLVDKKVFLMSTSNGGRGAIGSLEVTEKIFSRFKGEVVETFSLPRFNQNFNDQEGITDKDLAQKHIEKLNSFTKAIS